MKGYKEEKGAKVKLTRKERISFSLTADLYSKIVIAAERDNRSLSNWLVLAAMEKLKAID